MKEKTSKGTYANRIAIGFPPDRREWKKAPAAFGRHSLQIAGHPVMEDWERDYMKLLASIAGSKCGTVLEVGFGMGISARFIQGYEIEEHLIIEANHAVFRRLTSFARKATQKVTPLLGFWEDITKSIPDESISSILFDTYPLAPGELHRNHFAFFKEAYRLLRKGGVFTYYSDEADWFSSKHLRALRRAGFRDIQGEICAVSPPAECQYWQEKTLLAPIIFKSR